MIGCCKQYHKPPEVCLNVITASIKEKFPEYEYHEKQYFEFYKDSALASVVIYFYDIKDQLYNHKHDIFTNNYISKYLKKNKIIF